MQVAVLPKYADLLPGAGEACTYMQQELNLKLGSTTGFTRAMVDVLLDTAVKSGYTPDYTVGGDEVRPLHGIIIVWFAALSATVCARDMFITSGGERDGIPADSVHDSEKSCQPQGLADGERRQGVGAYC